MPEPTNNPVNADPKGQSAGTPKGDGLPNNPVVQNQEGQQQKTSNRPEWLLDKFKTPEEQAKSYAEAERAMSQSRSEVEKLKLELEELKNGNYGQPAPQVENTPSAPVPSLSPEQRAMIEARYGGQVSFEMLQALGDVVSHVVQQKIQPIQDSSHINKAEQVKQTYYVNSPVYGKYKSEIDAEINKFKPVERSSPKVLEACEAVVARRHFNDLQNEWIEMGKKQALASPQVPYAGQPSAGANGAGNANFPFKLTPEQRAMSLKYGGNPDEDEKKINERYGR